MRTKEILLEFAGISLLTRCNSPLFLSKIANQYSPWLTSTVSHLCITIKFAPYNELPNDCTGVKSDNNNSTHIFSHNGLVIEIDEATGETTFTIAESELLFARALRIFLSHVLPANNGFLIHASSVIAPLSGGFIFMGKSGAGKTTISRILQDDGCTISNDELSIIRRTRD